MRVSYGEPPGGGGGGTSTCVHLPFWQTTTFEKPVAFRAASAPHVAFSLGHDVPTSFAMSPGHVGDAAEPVGAGGAAEAGGLEDGPHAAAMVSTSEVSRDISNSLTCGLEHRSTAEVAEPKSSTNTP